jgi:DNA polymerase|tara:strand:+ start:315 stop:956 length:642 start_codon:yes stop_codon:yes gene_type:complete
LQFTTQQHQPQIKEHNRYLDCENCARSNTRNKVCLWRNQIPAGILFIGEFPDMIEDQIGQPFVGIAGAMLDEMIAAVSVQVRRDFEDQLAPENHHLITNIKTCVTTAVSCYGDEPPTDEEREACLPRLLELIKIVNPQLIVLVGIDQLIPKIATNTDYEHWYKLSGKFLKDIPIIQIDSPQKLMELSEQVGKESIVPLYRVQVSKIVNAIRDL